MAEVIASAIPKESYAQRLNERQMRKFKVSIHLADCFQLGLKGQPINVEQAFNYYEKAATNDNDSEQNAEAVTAMAILHYLQILRSLYGFTTKETKELIYLPLNVVERLRELDTKEGWIDMYHSSLYDNMLSWLELSAELNWISGLMVTLAERAYKDGIRTPHPKVEHLLRRNYETVKLIRNEYLPNNSARCANTKCTVIVSDPSVLIKCSNCQTFKYCTKDCQVDHWKMIHKKECVKKDGHFLLYIYLFQ